MANNVKSVSDSATTVRNINMISVMKAVGYSPTVIKPMVSKSFKNTFGIDLPLEWNSIISVTDAEKIKKAAVNGSGKFTEQWAAINIADHTIDKVPAEIRQGGTMAEIDAIVDAFKKGVKKLKPLSLEALKEGLETLELELAMAKD